MATATVDQEKTGLGNYFIANYPPFSFWKQNYLPDALEALHRDPLPGTPLGLYLHIPFCRKRCKFCYFRVYTDKNAKDIEVYLDALLKEVSLLSKTGCVGGRHLDYVYFGGGTPSYLSATQLSALMGKLQEITALGPEGPRSHLRMRTGNAAAAQACQPSANGRDAPQSGRRELQARNPAI